MNLSGRSGAGRRSAIVVLVAGLVLLATPLAVWGQAADEAPTFTGFSLEADASGMSIIFGNPDSQPYPLGLGTVPSTVSSLSTGPSGFAQASAAWPGPLASNAGSLAATVLPLCDPTGRGVCTPKPDSKTLAYLNYPVRAEASSPAGQNDDAQGPLYAHSKDNASSANATVADFAAGGLVSSARVTTVSRTSATASAATSIGETVVSGVSAAGGAIKIDSVHTIAKVVTNGIKSTRTRQISVAGLEIGGQKATVDESGVHFAGQGSDNPLNPAVAQFNQAFKDSGIEMFLSKPFSDTDKDGTVRLNTGAVAIVWKIPQSGGYQAIITLGGSGVVSQASAGSTLEVPGLSGASDLSGLGGGAAGATGATGGNSSTGGVGTALGSGGATGATGAAVPVAANAPGAVGTRLVTERVAGHVGFSGIALILVLAAIAGALLAGVGLGRLQLLALEPRRGGACQNGGRR
jgi:hypothetical protein